MLNSILCLVIALFSSSLFAEGDAELPEVERNHRVEEISKSIKSAENNLSKKNQAYRKTMGIVYKINEELKQSSEKRQRVQNRLVSAEANVKHLSQDIVEMQAKLEEQRKWLGKRLKAIYKFNNMGPIALFMNNGNSGNIERNLRYLKSVADRDYVIINSYYDNLEKLRKKNIRLKKNVKNLLAQQQQMKSIESKLESSQRLKKKLLVQIENQKQRAEGKVLKIKKLALSENLQNELMGMGFFLQKGRVPWPVQGTIQRRYGLIKNRDYRFKLFNKGIWINVDNGADIRSVHQGKVEYSGPLPTVGNSIVINHGSNYFTVYSGVQLTEVFQGDSVKAGEIIGTMGATNQTFYFEIRHYTDALNPEHWLNRKLLVKAQKGKNNT